MITSPRTSLGLLAAAAACAAAAAFLPMAADPTGFWTWPWAVVGGLLLVVLVPGLWRRRRALTAVRTAGGWGMHLGLVLVVAAGGWYGMFARSGGLEIIEGQTVPVADSGVSIRLRKLDPLYFVDGRPWGDAAEVEVIEHGHVVRTDVVHVNRPLRIGSIWITLAIHGYAPLLTVSPAAGKPVDDVGTFVSLNTVLTPVIRYWRQVEAVPGTVLPATLVFRPSLGGRFLHDPRLTLLLTGAGHSTIALRLAPGRPVTAAGYRFALGEVRRWGGFTVRREPGLQLLFAGCWIAIAGAAWSMLAGMFRVRG